MSFSDTLKDLGLNEQESSAYVALLKLGGSHASAIAKEMGIKRTTAYPILRSLTHKGIASLYFHSNTRYYQPVKPKKLKSIFEKKLEALSDLIPKLESIEKKQADVFGLRFIETKDELKQFYEQILDEYKNKEYCAVGSTANWSAIDDDFFINFRKRRAKNNIRTRLILSGDSIKVNPTDPTLKREFKYLPKQYKFKSTIDIYDDKILIVGPSIQSLAIVVEVPAMVDIFKSIFEILWETKEVFQNK
ncbi:MAG: Transcriptional regulator, TrmB [Candidatus Moranbacteria bacterium GW2011_GWE1_36_7]|nr:MAG: Transcriptional regulator, TrmB [Candidatus Moranbacteria bacterium GW2011_GWE2_36_40]KKQ13553.1 MAG: Transcriptional regulator, TrmB [Candidatus Moranbacteria bacterium GW2011_GWE1_36_7]KKQ46717.1 MAG: Transcriptional regulator, TrmB [Candidatus Moranbacteria bacterium GW2011_GWD2_37_9]